MAGRRTRARRVAAAVAVALVAAAAVAVWSVKREIPFDPERWKDPSWVTDRSRMLRDLQAKLESRQWSRDELLPMLEGEPERRDPRRASLLAQPSDAFGLVYAVPDPSPYWPLVRDTDNLELHLYFRRDGRFQYCELHSDQSH